MHSQGCHSADTQHPELTVSGFVRRKSQQFIPIGILNLIETFYSLWIKHRLSKEDLRALDLLHLHGLPLILASTCCKAIFRSSFGPSRRDLACCQRIPIHIFYRQDLENDGIVQMRSEKPLCSRWMRASTATPVNAKGLLKKLEVGPSQTIDIPILDFTIQGTRIDLVLEGKRGQDSQTLAYSNLCLTLRLRIPAEIQFIAGNFAAHYDEDWVPFAEWKTFSNRASGCKGKSYTRLYVKGWGFCVSEFQSRDDFFVIGYMDIAQIKWSNKRAKALDITPPLKRSGRYHLSINEEDLSDLKADIAVSKTPNEEWHFWVETFPPSHRHRWEGVRLRGRPSFLPLNVGQMNFQWTVRHQITGKRYRKEVQNVRGEPFANANLKVDDLENESRIEIDIEYQITNLYVIEDYLGMSILLQEIKETDWWKCKVV